MDTNHAIRVLFVANSKIGEGRFSHFVNEQIKALKVEGVEAVCMGMTENGLFGYIKFIRNLIKKIKETHPDIVHAHYGFCGLCANMQRMVPVVTTYHGSDIHSKGWKLALSKISIRLSAHNIFVSKKLLSISGAHGPKVSVVPCGIDLSAIYSIPRNEAKERLNRPSPFVLFSGSFGNSVKNSKLAMAAMEKVPGVELVQLEGFSRQEVNLLMNAASCLLMTSHREGSPQVIKEAMACGTPIVSVDVGDVRNVMGETEGCYLGKYDADDLAEKIKKAMAFEGKTDGRQRVIDLGFDNNDIAKNIVSIYGKILE